MKQRNFRQGNSAGIQILGFSKDTYLEYIWRTLCAAYVVTVIDAWLGHAIQISVLEIYKNPHPGTDTQSNPSSMHIYN